MMIREFFKEIDAAWGKASGHKIILKVLGSAALFLQCDYVRGTKDADIFEVDDVTPNVKKRLLQIAGKKSRLCKKYRVSVDVVGRAIAFLPAKPSFHSAKDINDQLNNFRVEVLDITDVIVSKLKRFIPADIGDIRTMIGMGLVKHDKLVERFKFAIDQWEMDSRANELPQIVKNLHTVERDMFSAKESRIELPEWVEE